MARNIDKLISLGGDSICQGPAFFEDQSSLLIRGFGTRTGEFAEANKRLLCL